MPGGYKDLGQVQADIWDTSTCQKEACPFFPYLQMPYLNHALQTPPNDLQIEEGYSVHDSQILQP